MKSFMILGLTVLAIGVGIPAMAADQQSVEFFAVSQVPTDSSLTTMTDQQLTKVEGMSWKSRCGCGGYGFNYSKINQANYAEQANINVVGVGVLQANQAAQSNNANVTQRN